jgi:hypothetical protein
MYAALCQHVSSSNVSASQSKLTEDALTQHGFSTAVHTVVAMLASPITRAFNLEKAH